MKGGLIVTSRFNEFRFMKQITFMQFICDQCLKIGYIRDEAIRERSIPEYTVLRLNEEFNEFLKVFYLKIYLYNYLIIWFYSI